jgi:hypothetical protein
MRYQQSNVFHLHVQMIIDTSQVIICHDRYISRGMGALDESLQQTQTGFFQLLLIKSRGKTEFLQQNKGLVINSIINTRMCAKSNIHRSIS